MTTSNQTRAIITTLASSLLLNFILVSCAAEATAPQAADNTEVLAKLDAVMARLAVIEAKFDPQTTALSTRIDSLGHVLLAANTHADTTVVAVGQGQVAKLDSIIALASYIANEQATGGTEACVGISAKAAFTVGPKADAKAEAAAHAGVWAGTGGYAGGKTTGKVEMKLEGSIEGPIGVEYCTPLGGEAPPIRAVPGAKLGGASASQRTALLNATAQLGITEAKVLSSMNVVSTALQAPMTLKLQDVGSMLPLPAGVTSIINDPMAALSATLPAKVDEAVNSLCHVNWGTRVAAPVATACARINSGLPDIGGLFSMMEQFPALQTTVTAVNTGLTTVTSGLATVTTGLSTVSTGLTSTTNRLATVCGRVNTFGNTSLTIPNPLNIGPEPLFGPTKLFSGFTSITC